MNKTIELLKHIKEYCEEYSVCEDCPMMLEDSGMCPFTEIPMAKERSPHQWESFYTKTIVNIEIKER